MPDAASRRPRLRRLRRLRGSGGSGDPVDPVEAEFAEYLDAVDAGRSSVVPLSVAAGRVAEVLPTSPDLAAWLACNPAGDLEDGALAGAASAYRRLAAWAQAGELAVVAQMASTVRRRRARPPAQRRTAVRPVPADAYGQVSLALTMSRPAREWWTNLAVDLRWRLAATGQALREGTHRPGPRQGHRRGHRRPGRRQGPCGRGQGPAQGRASRPPASCGRRCAAR